nr:MAG TPA: Transcription initiation factor IIE, alpha FINGER, Transcription [Caudoviricetes sp.]
MAEYIEREEALQQCSRFGDYTAWSISDGIGSIQAADVAPVVHGRWLEREDPMLDVYYVCSVCKEDFYIEATGYYTEDDLFVYTYCPNCGAKMDKREDTQ